MKHQRFLVQLLDIRHDGAFPGCSFPKLAQGLEVPHHQRRKVPPVLRNTFFFQVIFPIFTLNHKKITALPVYTHLDITLC